MNEHLKARPARMKAQSSVFLWYRLLCFNWFKLQVNLFVDTFVNYCDYLSGDENGCMVSTCRLYACPLPLHAATDLHLWGAIALTQKSPRLNVRAFITSEITHSNDAQCSTKEQP